MSLQDASLTWTVVTGTCAQEHGLLHLGLGLGHILGTLYPSLLTARHRPGIRVGLVARFI